MRKKYRHYPPNKPLLIKIHHSISMSASRKPLLQQPHANIRLANRLSQLNRWSQALYAK